MHECDKVKDYTECISNAGQKLVLLKERTRPKNMTKDEAIEFERTKYDTVAVYSVWTAWVKLPDGAEKCERCAQYRILNVNGYCHDCLTHLNFEKKRAH